MSETARETWFDLTEFASMTGFSAGLQTFEDKGEVKWTNTATDMHTGGVHGIRYKAEKTGENSLDIIVQHWVHKPGPQGVKGIQEQDPNALVFRTETKVNEAGRPQVRPLSARWMGREFKRPDDLFRLMHIAQETSGIIRANIEHNTDRRTAFNRASSADKSDQVKQRDEIPNLYDIAERCGMKTYLNLEGMKENGEFDFKPFAGSEHAPAYPLQLLRAMLGVEDDIVQFGVQDFERTVSIPVPGGYHTASYSYSPGRDKDGLELTCRVQSVNAKGQDREILYRIAFRKDVADDHLMRLESLEMLGNAPDMTDHKGVARAIRAMKYINMAIKRDEAPVFSDIINMHDLKAFLRRPVPPTTGPSNPRTMVQVLGANLDAVFTEREKSIGSNGMIIIDDFLDGEKNWVKQGIGIDWGVTFGDPEKTFYHTITPNYGRFLRHPKSPHIKPYVDNTHLLLITHEHEDHMRGDARFVKAGYEWPPMVMNKHSLRAFKRMLSEEGVPKNRIEEVEARCHVIDIRKAIDPQNPLIVRTHVYGDTVIEQGAEAIWSESEQRTKYFPLLTTYTKQHPQAKKTIRIGPAGHSAHALMFEIDGILYTGDYKLDQTLPGNLRTDLDWLAKCRDATVHIQESTNAAKDVPYNPTVAEVKENRKQLLRQERGNRILYDTIGSNAVDIEMFCRAAGEVRKELEQAGEARPPFKYIVFAGSAVRNKYGDLNDSEGFKAMMRRAYGIETLHIDAGAAQELLSGERDDSYIVVMTGTQDEALSITHRVSRDLHDTIHLQPGDAVIRGQMPIPGESRAAVRQEQNNRYRHDFGCTVYDAGEMARKGQHIYASSHASQDDYRQMHAATGDVLKLLNHGGPQQLKAMQGLMKDMGARAIVPDKQVLYELDRANKTVRIAGETPEERVGYREIRADQDEFFKKQRQQATVIRVKDRWSGPVADKMYGFENAAAKREEQRLRAKPTGRGANASEAFNEHANGMFPQIGILDPDVKRPYYEHHKNIKLFVAMDTEGTGTNVATDVHTDASFVATTLDNSVLETKTLQHRLRRYLLGSPGALAVTGNKDPITLHTRGLPLREYALRLYQTYRQWPQQLLKDKKARAVFVGWNNGRYDDPIAMRMFGMALASSDMKPMATYGNLQLDLRHLYTALIALMPDKVGAVADKDGHYIRTLEQACKSNGVEYADADKHGSLYDAQRVRELLFKFKKLAPDVFEQMVMNCDFSASRRAPVIDRILGEGLHLNDQAPVFGYVDMRDRTCQPRLGALVTIDTKVSKATDAIVLDLAKADIHKLEQLPDAMLIELMNDPDGPFAVIKLNNSPCLFPPQFVWNDARARGRAVGRLPKHTLLHRANALKQLRSDSKNVGNNFIQRVQRLYPESKLCRTGAARHSADPVNDNRQSRAFRLPNERIFSLFHLIKSINQIKNRHYKDAARLLRSLQPSDAEFEKDFDRNAFWGKALKQAQRLSKETGGHDPYIEDMRFIIEWMVDDVNSDLLPDKDRLRVNALKSAMLHGPDNAHTMTVERFMKELERIESDPDQFERLIGSGDEAKQKWIGLKATYMAYAQQLDRSQSYAMTDAKRERVRAYRRTNNPGGPGIRIG
jgi:mRNA degradation ribonuclease J1/J2/exonuclease I